jgi:sporulation protein YlmC with PRC-barrel domain
MRTPRTALLAGAVALLSSALPALGAVAQTSPTPPAAGEGPPSIVPEKLGRPINPQAPVTPDADPAVKRHLFVGSEHMQPGEHSAKALLGLSVTRPGGEPRGQIVDVLFDDAGFAERVVVQDKQILGPSGEPEELRFWAIDWPDREGEPARAIAARELDPAEPADRSAQVSAAAMLGADIANHTGTVVGTIHDIIIGTRNRARLVVFALAGIADVSDNLVAVPFRTVRRIEGTDEFLADLVGQPRGGLVSFRYEEGG